MFADDTNLLTKESSRVPIEQLLEKTFLEWSERVHPDKYERLHAGGITSETYTAAARFLGAWIQANGKHDKDTKRRLQKANLVWRRFFKQIGRVSVDDKHLGLLVRSTVEACLLFACESRTSSRRQLQQYQSFMNKVTLGLCQQRKIEMHEKQIPMQDLRKRLSIDPVEISIGWRQLQFIGHQAR